MRLRIGPATWRVRTAPIDPDKLGVTRTAKHRIHLSPAQDASSRRDTLLHECLHAIFYESGLASVLAVSDDDEERFIRLLTPWLLALLRDNPRLVIFLLEP